jgi:hypothetical protein
VTRHGPHRSYARERAESVDVMRGILWCLAGCAMFYAPVGAAMWWMWWR